jgi:hypothetical protein
VLAKNLKSPIRIIGTCNTCTRRLTLQNFPQGFSDDDKEDEDREKFKAVSNAWDASFVPRRCVCVCVCVCV